MTPDTQTSFKGKLEKAHRRIWQKWFKNLLRSLCRVYFPTLDAKWAVAKLEAKFGGPLAHQPKPYPAQEARFWGHGAALLDYSQEKLLAVPESDWTDAEQRSQNIQWLAEAVKMCNDMVQTRTGELPFKERAVFRKEFAYAYSKTFTASGELRGWTDATPIHLQLLPASLLWLRTRPPRTVTEWHNWLLKQRPRPEQTRLMDLPAKAKQALEAMRPTDEQIEAKELRRLQKICDRLGLHFGRCPGRRANRT